MLGGCGPAPADLEWRAPTMGTTYAVKVVAAPAGITRAALQIEVEAILARIDRSFSVYREDSEISRFNRAPARDWQPVSLDVVTVVAAAEQMSRDSDGAFDITAKPLIALWGFGALPREARIPSPAEVREASARVGFRKLQYRMSPAALRKLSVGLELDPNALVAGYAADLVAARFDELGIHHYLVDMGGEFRLKGNNARGEAWRIAVEDPRPDAQQSWRVLALTDCAVSTSGTYLNYFELDGRRYSHVLDPRKGWPVGHGLTSVTVIAPSAMQADAWATALLTLGEVQGLALAERERVAALFLSVRDGRFDEKTTSAFDARSARGGALRLSP